MNIAVRYGLLIALAGIVISLIWQFSGLQETMGWLGTVLGLLILVVGLHLAIKAGKEATAEEYPFGKAFGVGFRTSLVNGLVTGIFSAIGAATFLKPMMEAQMVTQREQMAAQGMAEDQIDQAMGMAEMFTSPGAVFVFSIVFALIGGAIISAILAAIHKRDEPVVAR